MTKKKRGIFEILRILFEKYHLGKKHIYSHQIPMSLVSSQAPPNMFVGSRYLATKMATWFKIVVPEGTGELDLSIQI